MTEGYETAAYRLHLLEWRKMTAMVSIACFAITEQPGLKWSS
jgi:hypothetical protein